MCGQDVTMIEPRLVIWNHLEAIPTKEFFFIFFFPVVFLLCGKKKKKKKSWAVPGEFDSSLSRDMTAIRVEEPDLFFLDFFLFVYLERQYFFNLMEFHYPTYLY